jgi:hypothetical protein
VTYILVQFFPKSDLYCGTEGVSYIWILKKRIERIMYDNIVSPRSVNVVFQRLRFTIQKDLAVQLAIYLPFVQM